jgi:hypothetical protein
MKNPVIKETSETNEENLMGLNSYLFAQLDRLSDKNITEEKLTLELQRSKGLISVGKVVITNATLAFEVEKFRVDYNRGTKAMPGMIENNPSKRIGN